MGCSDLKPQGMGQGQGEQSEGRPALGWRGREGEREGVQTAFLEFSLQGGEIWAGVGLCALKTL